MKRNMKVISISLMIILTSIVIILFEMKSYTPIDKDESGIIENYDVVTKRMEDKIKTRKAKEEETENSFEKRLENETKIAKECNYETDRIIKKYGIKKILKFENTPNNLSARKKICALYNCDSEEVKEFSAFWGVDNVSAVEFDFNDDGNKEIIGSWSANRGHRGVCLNFIDKNEKESNWLICEAASKEIIVLNHKTNGYYDIVITVKTFMGVPYKEIFTDYAE